MSEIQIYGGIGADAWDDMQVGAADVKAMLDDIGETDKITVRLNSPGGDVFEGIAIYNLLTQHPAEIEVRIDGWAASAASVIACAGDTVVMGTGANILIHNPWTMAIGDANDFRAEAELLDKIKVSIIEIYQTKTTASTEELAAWMDAERVILSDEAQEIGFAEVSAKKVAPLKSIANCKWIKNKVEVDDKTTEDFKLPKDCDSAELRRKLHALVAHAETDLQQQHYRNLNS